MNVTTSRSRRATIARPTPPAPLPADRNPNHPDPTRNPEPLEPEFELDPAFDPDHNPDELPDPDEDEAAGLVVCRNPDCRRPHVHRRGLCWNCYRDPTLRGRFPAYSRYTRDKRLRAREMRFDPSVPYDPLTPEKIRELARRADERLELFSPRDGAFSRGTLAFAARLPPGTRIAYLRRTLEWTGAHLARQAGVDPEMLRRWESGRFTPSLENFQKLATVLNVKLEVLMAT